MAGALALVVACGTSPPDARIDDPASSAPPAVRGTYGPGQPSTATVWSEFIAVDFVDERHFVLMRARPCADDSSGRDACLVRGTYTITRDSLILTDPNGTLASFSIKKTTPATAGTTGTHIQTALVEGAVELLPGLAKELSLEDSEGRATQIQTAAAECMQGVTGTGANCGARCPGGFWCIRYPPSRIGALPRAADRLRQRG
jgi:hypothetical protein